VLENVICAIAMYETIFFLTYLERKRSIKMVLKNVIKESILVGN